MKVMRERRFLVALAAVSAIVMGSAGTSSAILGDDGYSYTQPGAELVMPFDATEGKSSFLLVSNIAGTSSSGGAQVTTHWTFWSENCDELADFSICLTLNDTVVVDPTNARSLTAGNQEQGPLINLTGKKGIVTVTAYETDPTCADFHANGAVLTDDALVGTFTFADTNVGYSFGNDAFGLGLNDAGTAVDDPATHELRDVREQVIADFDVRVAEHRVRGHAVVRHAFVAQAAAALRGHEPPRDDARRCRRRPVRNRVSRNGSQWVHDHANRRATAPAVVAALPGVPAD